MTDTIEARFTTVLNTNERLKRELSAAKAEIARLREWKTAAENLIEEVRLDTGIAYPWPALDIADAALKPDTGE